MKVFLAALILAGGATLPAMADELSFTGTFSTDDQVQLFDFSVAATSTVTFQSWGYGGGTNAAGTPISAGGFDSFFTWFDGSGNQIGTDDDGCGNALTNNGVCLDASSQVVLTAGNYTLALTESGNDPAGGLTDGFIEAGQGDFTASGACTAFCDTFGNTDNGNWAVDILNVTASGSSTPEPANFMLAGFGLVVAGFARRHGKRTISGFPEGK